jgi:methylmalonyl-CoA/ethylmalonyl-CoA epimerase
MFENLGIIQLSRPDQIGLVVENVDAAVLQYSRLLGISNFEIVDWPAPGVDPESTYYGKPGRWKMRTGFATLGDMQFELIQPQEGTSIFKDALESRGPGIHHFRFTVPDFDEKAACLQKAGIQMIASGRGIHGSSHWAYFDTAELLQGVYIELRKV